MAAPKLQLAPGRSYCWQVQATDDMSDSACSEVSIFEGGHPEGPWKGCWIKAPFAPELHPLFQKTFEISREELDSLKARLYICGLGLYEVWINGQKAGEEYLTSYFTDYRYRIQYQTYDVTRCLRPGKNRKDVLLGNGWYKGKFGYLNKGQLQN